MVNRIKDFDLGESRSLAVLQIDETDSPRKGKRGSFKIVEEDFSKLETRERARNIESPDEAILEAESILEEDDLELI